jgi:hypothetical protein
MEKLGQSPSAGKVKALKQLAISTPRQKTVQLPAVGVPGSAPDRQTPPDPVSGQQVTSRTLPTFSVPSSGSTPTFSNFSPPQLRQAESRSLTLSVPSRPAPPQLPTYSPPTVSSGPHFPSHSPPPTVPTLSLSSPLPASQPQSQPNALPHFPFPTPIRHPKTDSTGQRVAPSRVLTAPRLTPEGPTGRPVRRVLTIDQL